MVTIEFRKIVSFGKGSFIVSLPKEWVGKQHLSKGDLLGVEEHPLGLLFTLRGSEQSPSKKKMTITNSGKSLDVLQTEIVSAYLNNADIIEIVARDIKGDAQYLKGILKNLAGMEVLEQTEGRIVAQYLLDKKEISIPMIIRRMDTITRAVITDAVEMLDGADHYESIRERDQDINRLNFLAKREVRGAITNPMIARSLGLTMWDLHASKIIIMHIERIADQQKHIARALTAGKLSRPHARALKALYLQARELYTDTMKSYYTKDITSASALEVLSRKTLSDADEMLSGIASSEAAAGDIAVTGSSLVAAVKVMECLRSMIGMTKYLARNVISLETT